MKNLIYIATLLVFISCKNEAEVQPETPENTNEISVTQKQFTSNGMQLGKLQEADFPDYIKATGKIDVPPQYKAKIASILGGYVVNSSVMIGDKVTKGQVLVTLENIELISIQKEYLEVAEQISYLKSEYERQKTLFDEKITSQKNYLKAQSDYNQALGSYNSLREKLILIGVNPSKVTKGTINKTFTVTSPISGIITQNNANVGAFITAENSIVEVVNPTQLVLNLAVFERDVMKLQNNQPIEFKITEVSDELFSSKVARIAKMIDEENRTVTVYGDLSDELKQKLVVGMFVEAKISIGNKKAMAIPNEAVFEEDNKTMVLLVDKKDNSNITFKKHEVVTGIKNEKFVEILPKSNLPENAEILVKGSYDIAN